MFCEQNTSTQHPNILLRSFARKAHVTIRSDRGATVLQHSPVFPIVLYRIGLSVSVIVQAFNPCHIACAWTTVLYRVSTASIVTPTHCLLSLMIRVQVLDRSLSPLHLHDMYPQRRIQQPQMPTSNETDQNLPYHQRCPANMVMLRVNQPICLSTHIYTHLRNTHRACWKAFLIIVNRSSFPRCPSLS